jgi:predicted nucleic acid-binding Zn ribbon protein
MSTFHLKGSGWYTTDYAGKNQSTAKQAESKPEKAENKTESASSTKDS